MNTSHMQGTTEPASYLNSGPASNNIGGNPQTAQLLQHGFATGLLLPDEEQMPYFCNPDHPNKATSGTSVRCRLLRVLPATTLKQHRHTPYSVERPSHAPHASNHCRHSCDSFSTMDTFDTVNSEPSEPESALSPSVPYDNLGESLEDMMSYYLPDDDSHNPVVATVATDGMVHANATIPSVTHSTPSVLSPSNTVPKAQVDIKKMNSEDKVQCNLILEKLYPCSWRMIANQFMSEQEIEAISMITESAEAIYQKMDKVCAQLCTRYETWDAIIQILNHAQNESTKGPQSWRTRIIQKNLQSCMKELSRLKNKAANLKHGKTSGATTHSVVTANQVALDNNVKKMDASEIRKHCQTILKDLYPRLWNIIASSFLSPEELTKMTFSFQSETKGKGSLRKKMDTVLAKLLDRKKFDKLESIIEVLREAKRICCTTFSRINIQQCIEKLTNLQKHEKNENTKAENSTMPNAITRDHSVATATDVSIKLTN